MRVLVTGGAGFIGSHTCKALSIAGHIPIIFDDLSTGYLESVKWGEFYEGNISNTSDIMTCVDKYKPEAVIHFAAFAYVGESVQNPAKYWQNNVIGTKTLLDAMIKTNLKKIVFSSSCATYGIPSILPISENSPQNPINPYGKTKFTCEEIIKDYAEAYGLGSVMLRYFNAAGADPEGEIGENHDPETHLIPLILLTAAGRLEEISIFGDDYPTQDGTCIRDYIHVSDLANAHVLALDHCERGTAKAFNLGTGRGYSVKECVKAAEVVTGRHIPIKICPRRAGDPAELVASVGAARDALGWTPTRSDIEFIMNTAWNWINR